MKDLSATTEYKAVSEFYKNDTARRSGIRKVNHIDEGLIILNEINAPT